MEQRVIIFNCPFLEWELLLKERICSQRERILSFRGVSFGMENNFYHIRWSPLNVTVSITQVRNCVMDATPMA